MYVSCTFNKNKFYFSNGPLILRRYCEDEGERTDVGVFRKDHRPSIRRGGAFQTSKMHMVGEMNNASVVMVVVVVVVVEVVVVTVLLVVLMGLVVVVVVVVSGGRPLHLSCRSTAFGK